jgi:outer membrane protein assembly factor BamB
MTMKLAASDGEILWRVHDDDRYRLDDRGWAIVVGPDDDPVVTGVLTTPTDPADFRTFKLRTFDGSPRWSRTVPGAVNFLGRAGGWLAVCDDGDVVMANRTWDAATSYDVVLQRYDAADGDTVWTTRYDSPGPGSDDPVHMIRDAAGDLLVAGVRSGDFMVLQFDATDGGLIWSRDYDGPTAGWDAAAAVAEGPGGEVIVTGFTTGDGTSWDVTTVALDPSDGSLLWEEHFDPGEGRSDEGKALAVGAAGDLYVTGYCDLSVTATDLVALHYRLADPTGAEAGPTPSGSPSLRISAHPNPFVRRLSLSVEVARPASLLAVYDVRGRRVARLHEGALPSGAHRLEWDGRDESGASVGSGVYFVRLESGGAAAVEKVVLTR